MMQETSTKSYIFLFLLLGSALLYVLFQGGKVAIMLFIMSLILFVYLILGRWSGIAKVQGQRNLLSLDERPELEAGTSVQIGLSFRIPGFWPLPYILVTDTLQRQDDVAWSVERSFVPDWKRRGRITYNTPPLRRGIYSFAQTNCSTEDVFGLFRHNGTLELKRTFRVFPKTVPIRNWVLFNQLAKGLLYHSASIKSRRETTQINGVREYVYGDRISRIHWNASARTGTWKSKEFERESLPRLLVALDAEQGRYRNEEDFELAVSIAASILKFSQKHGLAAGITINSHIPVWKEMKSHDIHYREMVNELVGVEAAGERSITHQLQSLETSFFSQAFVILVSSSIDPLRSDFQLWLEGEQLPGCYFHIPSSERAFQRAFISEGSPSGAMLQSYSIRKLDDLPYLLEGGEG